MSEATREQDGLVHRIERLERENRRLKRGALAGLVALAALVSIGLMAQTQTPTKTPTPRKGTKAAAAAPAPAPTPPAPVVLPKDIEAESFVLKDSSGKVRAELSMSGTGPSFKLRDQSGSALVTLSLNDSAPGGPLLLLSDPQHHAALAMSVLEGAGSQVMLTGERPDIQAHIGGAPDGPTLELSERDGFSTSIGSGVQPTKGGQSKKTTAASITLLGKARKLLWSEP